MKAQNDGVLEIVTPRHLFTAKQDDTVCQLLNEYTKLFLCDSCLSFFSSADHLKEHCMTCANAFWIPGSEIYRDASRGFIVFEIDGRKFQGVPFARRLGMLTKFFLPDKVTLDDVHFFAFNTLFEVDDYGFHFAGYFSKEWKNSSCCINTLSCVMVLPPYRSKGYGSLLAELSYAIARQENMSGTPERPLSRSGKALFRRVWQREVLQAILVLEERGQPVTLNAICETSSLIVEDVLVALHDLGVLYTVGKQGPLIVLGRDRAREAVRSGKLSSEKLQWVSPS